MLLYFAVIIFILSRILRFSSTQTNKRMKTKYTSGNRLLILTRIFYWFWFSSRWTQFYFVKIANLLRNSCTKFAKYKMEFSFPTKFRKVAPEFKLEKSNCSFSFDIFYGTNCVGEHTGHKVRGEGLYGISRYPGRSVRICRVLWR